MGEVPPRIPEASAPRPATDDAACVGDGPHSESVTPAQAVQGVGSNRKCAEELRSDRDARCHNPSSLEVEILAGACNSDLILEKMPAEHDLTSGIRMQRSVSGIEISHAASMSPFLFTFFSCCQSQGRVRE